MEKITWTSEDAYIKALADISALSLEELLKLIVMVSAKATGVDICIKSAPINNPQTGEGSIYEFSETQCKRGT
ncbi:MAG: hypothetical protein WBY88_12850 [Desulfosarcina sp.]